MIYLSNVFVDKDSRGKGLGNDILRKAEVEARKMGGAYLRLKCLSTAWVHEWYEKHGWSDLCADKNVRYFWKRNYRQRVFLKNIQGVEETSAKQRELK